MTKRRHKHLRGIESLKSEEGDGRQKRYTGPGGGTSGNAPGAFLDREKNLSELVPSRVSKSLFLGSSGIATGGRDPQERRPKGGVQDLHKS